MKRMKQSIISAAMLAIVMLGLATTPLAVASASPADQISNGVTSAGGNSDKVSLGEKIKMVINVLLFIIGAVAVIMIIVGGLRYTTSNGESSQITAAKNTIMYAVIGIVVALMAYAIVNFVVKQFS